MQATITYLLSKQAQRAQMAATGQPVARKQTATVDITAEDLEYYPVNDDGTIEIDLTGGRHSVYQPYNLRNLMMVGGGHIEHSAIPDIPAIVRAGRDYAEAEKQQVKDKAVHDAEAARQRAAQLVVDLASLTDRVMADPNARWCGGTDRDVRWGADSWTSTEKLRSLDGWGVISAELERRKAADESEAIAKEAVKTEAIAAFVAASGDALLIEQYAAGLLCRKAVISRMAAAALDAAGLPRKCEDPTVCDDSDCPCGDAVATCIPPEVYRRWKAIGPEVKTAAINPSLTSMSGEPVQVVSHGPLPEGSTVEFHEVRECLKPEPGSYDTLDDGDETAGPTEYHAVVTIPSGPFKFTRRVKV
jgi:hypothetical protein